MSFSLIPDYSFDKLTDITGDFLKELGVGLLLLDLDNTVSPYGEKDPSEEAIAWFEKLKGEGITLFFVSNTKKPRADHFAERLGVGLIKHSRKPSPKGVNEALKMHGVSKFDAALVGDQIFTDTLAANRAGVVSLLVEPIKFTNPFLAIRYGVEIPFRILARHDLRSKHR